MNGDCVDRATPNHFVDAGSQRLIGSLGDQFRHSTRAHAKDLWHQMNALAMALTGIGVDMNMHVSPISSLPQTASTLPCAPSRSQELLFQAVCQIVADRVQRLASVPLLLNPDALLWAEANRLFDLGAQRLRRILHQDVRKSSVVQVKDLRRCVFALPMSIAAL